MDPNATLAIMREIVTRARLFHDDPAAYYASAEDDPAEDLVTLAEHAEALDEWLSRGGFLPDAWER